jgi:hypothetical protein
MSAAAGWLAGWLEIFNGEFGERCGETDRE